jgi:hypothetical protein
MKEKYHILLATLPPAIGAIIIQKQFVAGMTDKDKQETSMARSKTPLASVIILALVLGLLFALNPTMDDFTAWRSSQARRQATAGQTSGLVGVMKKGVGAIAGGLTGLASGFFERNDYLFFSTYSAGKKGDLYLGAARLFVKLR